MRLEHNQKQGISGSRLVESEDILTDNIIEKQLLSEAYKHVCCNFCGSDDWTIFALSNEEELHKRRVKCKKCGLVYSNPQGTEPTLKHYYGVHGKDKSIEMIIRGHESLTAQYNRIFSSFGEKSKGETFLDVGCSTGHFINEGRKYGWDVYGIDISPRCVEYAREKFGLLNVQCTDIFSTQYPDDFFDYVWLWHVLEHVPDAMGMLTEINRILKPGGKLRIGVPCVKDPIYYIRFRGSDIKGFSSDPAHTYEFTPNVLKKMVEKANFRVNRTEVYYNPGSLKKFLTYRSSWKAKKIIYFLYYLSKAIPNRFGHRVAVHCVKK